MPHTLASGSGGESPKLACEGSIPSEGAMPPPADLAARFLPELRRVRLLPGAPRLCGGIGRRAGFKHQCSRTCGFDSHHRHQRPTHAPTRRRPGSQESAWITTCSTMSTDVNCSKWSAVSAVCCTSRKRDEEQSTTLRVAHAGIVLAASTPGFHPGRAGSNPATCSTPVGSSPAGPIE